MKKRSLVLITIISFLIFTQTSSAQTLPTHVKIPHHNTSSPGPTRHQQLLHHTTFTAKGKMSFQQGKHGGNASFEWKQSNKHFDITLIGALGAGSIKIVNNGNLVTLTTSKGEVFTAKTAEELLKKLLGWTVPISPLHYWIRGIPDPNHPIKTATAAEGNCLSFLEQEGWKVTYQSYMKVGNLTFPQKILLQHGNIRIRLIFKQWM